MKIEVGEKFVVGGNDSEEFCKYQTGSKRIFVQGRLAFRFLEFRMVKVNGDVVEVFSLHWFTSFVLKLTGFTSLEEDLDLSRKKDTFSASSHS